VKKQREEFTMNNVVRKTILAISLASITVAISGCNSRVGTYSNENGTIVLDLKSGGKASLTFLGESKPCSYSEEKNQVTVACEGDRRSL